MCPRDGFLWPKNSCYNANLKAKKVWKWFVWEQINKNTKVLYFWTLMPFTTKQPLWIASIRSHGWYSGYDWRICHKIILNSCWGQMFGFCPQNGQSQLWCYREGCGKNLGRSIFNRKKNLSSCSFWVSTPNIPNDVNVEWLHFGENILWGLY